MRHRCRYLGLASLLLVALTGATAPRTMATEAAGNAGAGLVVARGRIEPVDGVRALGIYAAVPMVPLRSLLVNEGDQVSAGQLLATTAAFDSAVAGIAVAEAALALAERKLDQAHRPWREGHLGAARAIVASRRADLELIDRQLRRIEDLVRRGVRSIAELDEKQAEQTRARAQLTEAEAQLAALTNVARTEIRVAEAERDQACAKLRQAEMERALAKLRAPIGGTILRLHARAGDIVSNRPVLELADMNRLEVVAEVEERLLPRLREGLSAEASLPAGGPRAALRVSRISQQVRLLERAQPDLVTGAGGRMVEVHLALPPGSPLPAIVGLEVLVRIGAP